MKAKRTKQQRFLIKQSANNSLSTSIHNSSHQFNEIHSSLFSPTNASKIEKPIHVFESLVSNWQVSKSKQKHLKPKIYKGPSLNDSQVSINRHERNWVEWGQAFSTQFVKSVSPPKSHHGRNIGAVNPAERVTLKSPVTTFKGESYHDFLKR